MTPAFPTLVHALQHRARTMADDPAFRTLPAAGAPAEEVWSWGRWAAESSALTRALQAGGIRSGDRVAVLAANVPLWPLVDLAIQWAGAVSVGLYPTSAAVQVAEVMADCGARAVLVDGPGQYAKVVEAASALPQLSLVVRPDGIAEAEMAHTVTQRAWSEFLTTGTQGADPAPPEPGTDAVIIYTSGSTGVPKGARISHRTLVASAESVRDTLGLVEGDTSLSILPFCHAGERMFGLATRLVVGMEAALVQDPARIFDAAATFEPTLFGGLPRFYEKIYEAELADRRASVRPEVSAVRRLLGSRIRVATSGGATLPPEVASTLEELGLVVLGAYGLTEHLCAAFNREGRHDHATVGHPMPGTEIRIAEDGEILLRRCDLTFQGYFGRPRETAEAFSDDGLWVKTGDLGSLDAEGRLRVTGRKKDLIALSTGKKVAPSRIEASLTEQPWIDQAVLLGEGRKYVSALLSLRRILVEAWSQENGLDLPWPELVRHPRVAAEIEAQVGMVNGSLSRTESVRRFEILDEPLTVASGLLTPTLKVRRDLVAREHAHRIAALYDEVGG